MKRENFQLLERRRLTPPGTLMRAIEAGLSSAPPRLADPIFSLPRGASFFSALAGSDGFLATELEPTLYGLALETLVKAFGESSAVVSLEAGSANTPMQLLTALSQARERLVYHPVDEDRGRLAAMGEVVLSGSSNVDVIAIEGDLREGVRFLKLEAPRGKGVLWMGGAINQHDPSVSEHLLRYVGASLQTGEFLLMGVDLREDVDALVRMCSLGSLADQHLALVPYLNDALGTSLDPDKFRFQVEAGNDGKRIALQIVSEGVQEWGIPKIPSLAGEPIETGYFYVYGKAEFERVVTAAGLSIESEWVDVSGGYGLFLLRGGGVEA